MGVPVTSACYPCRPFRKPWPRPETRRADGNALLRERIRRIFREFPGTLAGEEEPVHQVRVAGRRLRVALPLLARKPGGRRVRKARRILRDLTRAAGAGRDLDVLLALFEKRLGELDEVSPEQRDLRRRMRAARTRSRSGLTEGILDLDIDGLRRHLRGDPGRRGPPDTETILSRTRTVSERDGRWCSRAWRRSATGTTPRPFTPCAGGSASCATPPRWTRRCGAGPPGRARPGRSSRTPSGSSTTCTSSPSGWGSRPQRAEARGRAGLAAAAAAERAFFEAEGRRLHAELLEAAARRAGRGCTADRDRGGSGRDDAKRRGSTGPSSSLRATDRPTAAATAASADATGPPTPAPGSTRPRRATPLDTEDEVRAEGRRGGLEARAGPRPAATRSTAARAVRAVRV